MAFFNEGANVSENLIGILIRHQAHAHLRFSPVWNRGLDAWSRIAADDSVNLKCRTSPDAARDICSIALSHLSTPVRFLEGLHTDPGCQKVFHLSLGQLRYLYVKT